MYPKNLLIFALYFLFVQESYAQSTFNVNYSVGFPTGDLENNIDAVSGRGFGAEFQGMISRHLAIGVNSGLQTFYQAQEYATYTEGTESISGRQYRYVNSIPILANAYYMFRPRQDINPYVGFGVGTVHQMRDTDIGLQRARIRTWQLSIKPEAGVIFRPFLRTGFKLAAKYYANFDSPELEGQSFLTLEVGVVFVTLY